MGQHEPGDDLGLDDAGQIFLKSQAPTEIRELGRNAEITESGELPAGNLVTQTIA
ncbi:hypothetical protein [Methylobacterium sp. J-068]|uniref:hypothetical protein n=1 Tax=Methylobacterium sp. J-068 TaxID=2836649 RepID=UPI001FBAEDD6|nr:hypothetical protein [Methylobacterium sp. J-068]MCJ2034272.1 hypothetical protein [Methylobacterium sp. J-068]